MSAFAGELKRLRKARMLTQKDLSNAAQVPVSTISELERGVSQHPHQDTVRRLAQALGLAGAELAAFYSAASAAALDPGEQPRGGRGPAAAAGGSRRGRSNLIAVVAAARRTLPRDIGSFTGREQKLKELLSGGESDVPTGICVVDGMAGVGKTAFAVHAAHLLAERFPDGQIYLELRGHVPGQAPTDPADALASLLQTVGVDARQIPQGIEERARLWRDRLTAQRILLLLDDASGSDQVRPLLPGNAGCLVLVTSRARLTALEDVQVITLDTLPPDEAAVLFVRLASRDDLSPGDPAVQEIVQLCGCLPLAVSILAARLRDHRSWTPAWLAADLAVARSRTELMHAENRSVSAAFSLSYKDLAGDEQRLFRRLGLCPGTDIDVYAACALDGTDRAVTRRHLEALYSRHLLGEPVPGRYKLHDLLREHARDLAEADRPADRQAATERLLNYYLLTARAAGRHFAQRPPQTADEDGTPAEAPPLATRQQATSWLEAERPNLHAAVSSAVSESPAHAASIPAAINAFLCTSGYWDQAWSLCQTALDAARRTRDRRAHASAHASLAMVQRLTGDFPGAITSGQRALKLYRALADQAGEAAALTHLGWAQYLNDELSAAKESLTAALRLYRDIGDQMGEAEALTHLGYVALTTGDPATASDALRRACQLSHAAGDQTTEANALDYLGAVQVQTGPYPEARATLAQALELHRAAGNRNDEAWTLTYLGYVRSEMGAADAAADLTQATRMFHDLGNQYGEAAALNHLGRALRLAGEHPDATLRQKEALKLFRAVHSQFGESNALQEIGVLQMLSGDTRASAESQAQALKIRQSLNNPNGEAECHNNLGDLLLAPDPVLARHNYERALLICRTSTAPLEEARALEGIGRCDLHDGQPDQAALHLRQALTIYQHLGSPNFRRVQALLPARP